MATTVDSGTREIPDWLNARSPWIQGPSWLLSGILHLTAAWLMWQLAQSPGCQAHRGEQVLEGREVGIFVRERGPEDPQEPGASPPRSNADAALLAASTAEDFRSELSMPPVPLALPSKELPRAIGVGPVPEFARQAAQAAAGPLVRSGGPSGRGDLGTGKGSKPGGGSGNGTSMYGIAAKGKKFVYVIDRSSSMTDVLVRAKNELMASLRGLDETQEFQVILFNNLPSELKNRFAVFHGTEADRRLVEDQLTAFQASGGTNRLLALQTALKHRPDVVYFLTDSEDEMTAAEREDIRLRLRGAQINCVEFGTGPPVTDSNGKQVRNFLHKLAEESGGGYAYFDITGGANR